MPTYPQSTPGPPPIFPAEPPAVKVLVAEDPFVSKFLRAMLERHGHQVITGDAEQASESLRQGRVQPQVVITNQPEAFLPLAGTLRLLYIAANPDPELALQFPACRVLRKPFRNDDLLEAVGELARSVVP